MKIREFRIVCKIPCDFFSWDMIRNLGHHIGLDIDQYLADDVRIEMVAEQTQLVVTVVLEELQPEGWRDRTKLRFRPHNRYELGFIMQASGLDRNFERWQSSVGTVGGSGGTVTAVYRVLARLIPNTEDQSEIIAHVTATPLSRKEARQRARPSQSEMFDRSGCYRLYA